MEVVAYHSELGHTSALVLERGRKWIKIIPIESHAVRIRKVPLTEEKFMSPATFKGQPYPLPRAVKIFKRHGRTFGITKTAKKALSGGN